MEEKKDTSAEEQDLGELETTATTATTPTTPTGQEVSRTMPEMQQRRLPYTVKKMTLQEVATVAKSLPVFDSKFGDEEARELLDEWQYKTIMTYPTLKASFGTRPDDGEEELTTRLSAGGARDQKKTDSCLI